MLVLMKLIKVIYLMKGWLLSKMNKPAVMTRMTTLDNADNSPMNMIGCIN